MQLIYPPHIFRKKSDSRKGIPCRIRKLNGSHPLRRLSQRGERAVSPWGIAAIDSEAESTVLYREMGVLIWTPQKMTHDRMFPRNGEATRRPDLCP